MRQIQLQNLLLYFKFLIKLRKLVTNLKLRCVIDKYLLKYQKCRRTRLEMGRIKLGPI